MYNVLTQPSFAFVIGSPCHTSFLTAHCSIAVHFGEYRATASHLYTGVVCAKCLIPTAVDLIPKKYMWYKSHTCMYILVFSTERIIWLVYMQNMRELHINQPLLKIYTVNN